MSNDASDYCLDMVNFCTYIGLILSIIGLNYETDKYLQNVTEQRNLMMTAPECRDVREFHLQVVIPIETGLE